jgi:hypothetical protein
MDKEFISYAHLNLKELGFNEPLAITGITKTLKSLSLYFTHCDNVMDGNVKAPLYQQAFTWFNDVYQYDVTFGIKKEFNIHFRI